MIRYTPITNAGILPRMLGADVIKRIEQRLDELRLSPRAASLRAGSNPDLFRSLLRKDKPANPTTETWRKIAEALEVTEAWLRFGEASEFRLAPEVRVPAPSDMPKDLPVMATAFGSLIAGEGGAIDGFDFFGGGPIDYVRRPPALALVPDAYAIYVSGDSMIPMHPPGELRMVNPRLPVRVGDSVIVQTRHWDEDPGQGYIKLLKQRRPDWIVLEQLNPTATIQIPTKFVASVHRVLTLNELFGV